MNKAAIRTEDDLGAISILNKFAEHCNETTGASFTISRNKIGDWKVSLVNAGMSFSHSNLLAAVMDADDWLVDKRRPVEVETKYTLYTRG